MSVTLTTTHENCYFRRSIPGFYETRHYPLNPLEQRTPAALAVT